MWTHLLVLYSARQGAKLTLRSPTTASITAAFRLGDAVAVGGGLLAHGLENLSEAKALTIICERQKMRLLALCLDFIVNSFL